MAILSTKLAAQARLCQIYSPRQITSSKWPSSCQPAFHSRTFSRRVTAQATAAEIDSEDGAAYSDPSQGDYYSILGVAPTAPEREIKKAYRQLMKDWHPDQSNDGESVEFSVFLNQVYETLMDPDSRAEYDVISGFCFAGVNPFVDTSYAPEFAFVDEFSCIGCRNCNNVCPKTFGMEEEYGRARVMKQEVDTPDKIQEAIDTCPVSCIHWVTAPQLTLLEETMARMERIDAWILMNGGGKGANLNVFAEASIAWEKRQAAQRAREQKVRWEWAPFQGAAGATMQDAARQSREAESSTDGDDAGTPKRPGRRVNVAEMAAAARKWRDYQRVKRQRNQKLLSASTMSSISD